MHNDTQPFAGTVVLQIGTALVSTRRLTLCDGGLYTCVATNRNSIPTYRNFTLTIGCELLITRIPAVGPQT